MRTCCAAQSAVIPHTALYETGYQQALDDFAIADLLHRIDAHFDKNLAVLGSIETEVLAAVLVQALAAHLDSDILTSYINATRYVPIGSSKLLNKLHLPRPLADLPGNFPDVEMPRFLYGDRLCWKTNKKDTDWGIVIGRFYSFAPHCRCWRWCYLIWLDTDSPSNAWVRTDIAWEDDLVPFETELPL
ncbi:MAG: hypothetical protein WA949_10375 [Phormidesmis sp.]